MANKQKIRIELIGSGFTGKAHAFEFSTAAPLFDLSFKLEIHTLADTTD